MNKSTIIEAVALYWPMALCACLYWLQRNSNKEIKRTFTASIMASTWIAATLPWLNDLCVNQDLWNFNVDHPFTLSYLPLSLYVGWILLWGALPALMLQYMSAVKIIILMLLLDLLTMPLFAPVMILDFSSNTWLWGEFFLLSVCLFPAVFLAKWVLHNERVGWRAALISTAFIMLILVVIPTSSETVRVDIVEKWLSYSLIEQCLWLASLLLVSLPGIASVQEFSRIGNGTPIPYDAPQKLVTTGVYSYIQNPMQISMVLVLLLWGMILSSWFVISLAAVAIIYCVGIANWSEQIDLEQRFGSQWKLYNKNISAWKYRLTPLPRTTLNKVNARIYIDAECKICRQLATWIKSKHSVSLAVHPASSWEGPQLKRITYLDPTTEEIQEGVKAIARVFQHMHLGWAWIGWLIAIPILAWIIQIAIDASGGGSKTGIKN